jgi:hypothetical protein
VALATFAVLLAGPGPAQACRFVGQQTPTLRQDAVKTSVIVYGRLQNARADETKVGGGTTELQILRVLKAHPILAKQRVLKLARYIPLHDPSYPRDMVLFIDVYKGQLDPFRGLAVKPQTVDSVLDYLKGVLTIDPRNKVKLLRHCFDYLDHANEQIARDAYVEFTNAAEQDLGQTARRVPGARLRRWLQDPRTPTERLDLYGRLLGECGGAGDARLLRTLLERLAARAEPVVSEGMLTAYVLLTPREGWAYLRTLLAPSESFRVRYTAFRTIRYLDTTRPGVIAKKDILDSLKSLLPQADFADFPIEYLRQQRYWDLTAQVFALHNLPSHQIPVIRRAIVRYALQCPGEPSRRFVVDLRRQDPGLVKDMEELLKLEAAP